MANPTRRSFLRAGVVVAGVSVPMGVASRALSAVTGTTGPALRRSTFQPHLGSSFAFDGADGSYGAVLSEVGDLNEAPAGDDRRFTLMFRANGARPVGGTYRLSHTEIGTMDLFVSPVGSGDLYEAVVSAA